jgi:hypothetical protein
VGLYGALTAVLLALAAVPLALAAGAAWFGIRRRGTAS